MPEGLKKQTKADHPSDLRFSRGGSICSYSPAELAKARTTGRPKDLIRVRVFSVALGSLRGKSQARAFLAPSFESIQSKSHPKITRQLVAKVMVFQAREFNVFGLQVGAILVGGGNPEFGKSNLL